MKNLIQKNSIPLCFKREECPVIFSSKNYSIYKILPQDFNPDYLTQEKEFISYSRTPKEITMIAETGSIARFQYEESDWRALHLNMKIPFEVFGVLSDILQNLSAQNVNILSISTYDTDYIFFKKMNLEKVVKTMRELNYQISFC